MIGHCDARVALTGHCDARVALFGCQGGETHASSAAWSYVTDRDGTSAGAKGNQERQRWREKKKEGRYSERHRENEGQGVKEEEEVCGKKGRKSEMSPSVNNMEQAFRNGSCDQQTCTACEHD